ISAVAGSSVTYSWVPSIGLYCTTCPNTVANPPFTNTYVVYVTDGNGCTNTASVPVDVGAIPFLSAIASPTLCTGGTALLDANETNISATCPSPQCPLQWNWYPPNTPPLNSNTVEDPTITPNTTTNLYVVVTSAYGCKDTAYATVYVQTIPSVSWTAWTPYITCEGYAVPLRANVSSNGASAYWEFGDNSVSTDYNPTPGSTNPWTSFPSPHIYNFGGTYSVSVVAINSICRDTIDTTFTINDMGKYLTVSPANVFTPNGDLTNDCFHPAMDIQNVPNITSPDSLEAALAQCIVLEVWDRWGIKMFESNDTDKCWNGKTKQGTDAKQGTYYYVARFKDVELKGFVELLR
ncbi:MAG: gliding motility-associated C-terminal domain-containing protein, partial [Bacteroidota bacterium]